MTTSNDENSKNPDLKVVGEDSTEASNSAVAGEGQAAPEPALPTVEELLAAKETELLRAQADFQNFRLRSSREKEDLRKYSTTSFARDLLPVLDAFEQCLKAEGIKPEASKETQGEPGSSDQANIKDKQGLELIATQFKNTLKKHGIEQIGAVGDSFDPQWHQAIRKEENPDATGDTILEVYAPGFKIYDRVLRPAMVAVSVAP